MDEVVVPIRMSGTDYVIIYNVARRERLSVGEWIMKTIIEKLEQIQMEQMKMQQQGGSSQKEIEKKIDVDTQN